MRKTIKRVFKKVTLTHLLLIIIAAVLFFGLFKREIPGWTRYWMPTIQTKYDGMVLKPCSKWIENPKWREEVDKVTNSYLDKCHAEKNNNYSFECYMGSLKVAKEVKLPESIEVSSTCEEKVYAKWFYFLGRYWFKLF